MSYEIKVEDADLLAALDKLEGPNLIKAMNKAIRAGGLVFQHEVEEQAPVKLPDDTPYATLGVSDSLPEGALKADVQLRKESSANRDGKYTEPLEYDVYFGTQTSHVASWVSEGHRLVKGGRSRINSSGKRSTAKNATGTVIGQVPGSGFFERAYDAAKDKAADAVIEAFDLLHKK